MISILEKVYKQGTNGLHYELAELNAVPPITIDYSTAYLKLRTIDDSMGFITGDLIDVNPSRYIIHRGHSLQVADNWGGPFRSILFWWLLKNMDRDWWSRFLDHFGAPFIVGKYDQADDASRQILTRAFGMAQKLFGLVVSTQTQVELIQANTQSNGEAFDKFLDRCNDEISKLIVGQVSSSKTMSGLGSGGVSKQHENVREDLRQNDQRKLGNTLRDNLFKPFLSINGIPGRPPLVVWGGVSNDEKQGYGTLLQSLAQAQITPTDDGLATIGERLAIPLQRMAPAPAPGGGPGGFSLFTPSDRQVTLSHRATDQIAAKAAPALAEAFRGSMAPMRRIIVESVSAADCEARIRAYYCDWSPERVAGLTAEALEVFAANGASQNVIDIDEK